MGRVSMPIMNKTGYSMYWNSMWDDKLNYSRSLKDNIFINDFIYLLFEGGYSSFFFLNLKDYEKNLNFLRLKKKYSFHTKKIFKKNDVGAIINYKLIKKKKKNLDLIYQKFEFFVTKLELLYIFMFIRLIWVNFLKSSIVNINTVLYIPMLLHVITILHWK